MDFEAKFMSRSGLVSLVDSMMYEIKTCRCKDDPLFISLKYHLRLFIEENKLNGDPHNFATLPEDVEL